MKNAKSLLAAVTLSSLSSLAVAEAYIGGNYAFIDADIVDLGAAVFKAGYQLNEWAAIEARAGFGVTDDSTRQFGVDVDVELDNMYGAYFVAGLPNDSVFYPYAIIGYTSAEVEASASHQGFSVSESADDSDFSYGLGSNIDINESLAGNIEFMRYMDKDDTTIDAVSVGLTYKF